MLGCSRCTNWLIHGIETTRKNTWSIGRGTLIIRIPGNLRKIFQKSLISSANFKQKKSRSYSTTMTTIKNCVFKPSPKMKRVNLSTKLSRINKPKLWIETTLWMATCLNYVNSTKKTCNWLTILRWSKGIKMMIVFLMIQGSLQKRYLTKL